MKLTPRPAHELPCYAIEHDSQSKRCQACPHQPACIVDMGRREGRISLDRATFQLVPVAFGKKLPGTPDEEHDLQSTFDLCHQQVFGAHSGQNIGRHREKILTLAKTARLDVRLFVLTSMIGYQKSWPDREFTALALVGNRALYRAKTYAQAARDDYAVLSDKSIDLLLRANTSDYEIHQRLEDSEVLAGAWIINFHLFHEGQPYDRMFTELETQLDPNWLALEPYYSDIFLSHVLVPGPLNPQRTHRHSVAEAMDRLKRHRNLAIGNFRARERIMPKAVARVLEQLHYSIDDFELPSSPVTDTLRMWNRLGLAIQHYECLKFLNHQPSAYSGAVTAPLTKAIPRRLLIPHNKI